MPIYEYSCRDCAEEFEFLTMGPEDRPRCPRCGGERMEKRLSSFATPRSGETAPAGGPCGACGLARRGMCSEFD